VVVARREATVVVGALTVSTIAQIAYSIPAKELDARAKARREDSAAEVKEKAAARRSGVSGVKAEAVTRGEAVATRKWARVRVRADPPNPSMPAPIRPRCRMLRR